VKLTNIQTSNFLGARAVDVRLAKPVALFAGKNGAGKSSLQEAVRMALTGELVRVDLKKDYGALISSGEESGFAEVFGTDEGQDFTTSVVLPSGKGQHSTDGTLNYVLDAQRFSRLDDNARRQFLFGLCGVKLDGPAVKQRMLDKGCTAGKVEQTVPLLRAGFDAAAKEAASKARDAKASWKTATGGETWGKDKAAKWEPAPLPDGADRASIRLESITKSRDEANATVSAAQQDLGAARAEHKRAAEAEAKRESLHEHAGKAERIRTKLNLDTAELAAWEQKVADCKARAGVAQPDPKSPGEYLLRGLASVTTEFLDVTCEYPDVAWPSELINRAAVSLREFRKLHGDPVGHDAQPDQEAIAKLPEYENALSLLQRSVANGKRDLESAQKAAADLKELEGIKAVSSIEAAQAKVNELTEKRDAWQADVDKYKEIAEKFNRRTSLMLKASLLHADVLEWAAISDALSPDGIPAELLSDALGPINARLATSGNNAQWRRINIGADMSIFAAEEGEQPRAYALLSESEKWRADAMIAEAVSHISGIKLLVLDRFDVLDLKGREDALYWLDDLAEAGEIDTALIFGTLKSLPAQLLPNIEGFWIENGVSGQMKEAA
jgi:hypothetical protein